MQAKAIILRAPQRAAATVAALNPLGISSHCVQLIDTVWPEDLSALDERLTGLLDAAYDWVVFTSVSTVQVIAQRLGERRLPPRTQIAAVGTKTAEVIEQLLARPANFVPQLQSAAGMVAQWQVPAASTVFYPHGDLAAPTLAEGLRSWGVQLDEAIAYYTVPAGSGGTPVAVAQIPAGLSVLTPEALPAALPETDLLIFAAPSIVREFVALIGTSLPPRVRTVAIGEPTARALQEHRLPVDATAPDPTPQALAHCAAQLLQTPSQNR